MSTSATRGPRPDRPAGPRRGEGAEIILELAVAFGVIAIIAVLVGQ